MPLLTDESTEGYPENTDTTTDVTFSGQDVQYVANTDTESSVTDADHPVRGSTSQHGG